MVPFLLVKIANWFSFLNASFSCVLKIFYRSIFFFFFFFFFTLEKIKYRSSLAASSDFTVTSGRLIIYSGNWTFPIVIMLVFTTKSYMKYLRSLFWFLLIISSILSLTAFPLISIGNPISAVPPSYERLTSKCSFFRNRSII